MFTPILAIKKKKKINNKVSHYFYSLVDWPLETFFRTISEIPQFFFSPKFHVCQLGTLCSVQHCSSSNPRPPTPEHLASLASLHSFQCSCRMEHAQILRGQYHLTDMHFRGPPDVCPQPHCPPPLCSSQDGLPWSPRADSTCAWL